MRRPRRALLLVVTCLLALLAAPAPGQGTGRQFADPLSFDGLTRLLVPLQLSPAQQAVAAVAHEAYLAGSLELRHGRIDAYLAEVGGMPLQFADDREAVEAAVRERRAILVDMRRLDEALFARLVGVLSEEQQALLPRLAARRERDRLEVDPTFGWMGLPPLSQLDLVDHLRAIELDADAMRAIDPLVADYESRIDPIWRSIHQKRSELPVALFHQRIAQEQQLEEHLAALERAREDADGGEEARRSFEEAAMSLEVDHGPRTLEESQAIARELARVSRINRSLLDDLRPRLDPLKAAALERRYVARAHPMQRIPGDRAGRRIERYLEANAEGEIARAVAALGEEHTAKRRAGQWRLLEEAEQEGFSTGNAMLFLAPGAAPERPEDPLAPHRDALRTLDRSTLERFAQLTGEEVELESKPRVITLGDGTTIEIAGGDGADGGEVAAGVFVMQTVDIAGGDGDDGGGFAAITFVGSPSVALGTDDAGGEAEVADDEPVRISFGGGGSWLPGPVEDAPAAGAGADGENALLAESLHAEYLARWRELDETTLGPARAGLRRLSRPGGEDGPDPEAAYGAVRAAMEQVQAVDQGLFDDLALVSEGEAAARAVDRAARRRRFAAFGAIAAGGFFGNGPGTGSRVQDVDLWSVAESVDGAEVGTPVLDAWLDDAIDARRTRWTERLAAAERQAVRMAKQRQESGGAMMFFSSGPSASSFAATRALEERTEAALGQLEAALAPEAWAAFEEAYLHAAYPSIYGERSALEPILERAATLELASDARARLAAVRSAFSSECFAIRRRMVGLARDFEQTRRESGGGFSPELFEAYQRYEQDQEAARFELRNLDQRVRQELADLLGPMAPAAGLVADDG